MHTDLESHIESLVIENLAKTKEASRYFYPLVSPTFGAREILEAIDSMVSFQTTMGRKVDEFEKRFGKKYGGHAVMVNSGSSADLLISFALLESSGGTLKPGDEVLVPSVTWPTHLWSLVMAGFSVKLVDVDPNSLNFSMRSIEASVTENTKAIFIVHLLGNAGPLDELSEFCKKKNLLLLEDCCEALGTHYGNQSVGTFGLASSFSFFFSHHMVTMEGGMILTTDKTFAEKCRLLRSHGWTRALLELERRSEVPFQDRYEFVSWGFNVRPTELQAAFGLHQLDRLEGFSTVRNEAAAVLSSAIARNSDLLSTMKILPEVQCSWFAFPIIVNENAPFTRNQLAQELEISGVETRPIVAGNLARQEATRTFSQIKFADLSGADLIHDRGIYIGIHPNQDKQSLLSVCQVIENFCQNWRSMGLKK